MGKKFRTSPPSEPVDAKEVRWQDHIGGLTCANRMGNGKWECRYPHQGINGEYTWEQLMERISKERWKTLRVIGPRGY